MIGRDELFKARLTEQTFNIEDVGEVRIRSLSRSEALAVKGMELSWDQIERKMISMAMVDPKLTEEEVAKWQDASPAGELEPVTNAILALSGMTPESPKDAMRRFRS